MIDKAISIVREWTNQATKSLIQNERIRKKMVVLYYNAQMVLLPPKRFHSEEENVFDYTKIVKDKRHLCREEYRGNGFYGTGKVLKDYSGFSGKIYACIEHGVYFGDYINERECVKSGFPAVITFGPKRIEHLKSKSSKLLYAIGPYIFYAHDLLSPEKIQQIKREFGKTLLVFPTHSIDRVSVDMNSVSLIQKINKFKEEHQFKTVLVCIYYKDVETGRNKEYEDAGFRVVSAGRREDDQFLNRLHTFFSIADYSISNNVGTHIGYSIVLGKPHMILTEEVHYKANSSAETRHVTTLYNDSAVLEKQHVLEAFEHYTDIITENQKEVCKEYWGLGQVRSPKEMNEILSLCSVLFYDAGKKEENFGRVLQKAKSTVPSYK